jgi:hypothetical protein
MPERLFPQLDGAVIAEEAVAALPPVFQVRRLYEERPSWPGADPLTRAAALQSLDEVSASSITSGTARDQLEPGR